MAASKKGKYPIKRGKKSQKVNTKGSNIDVKFIEEEVLDETPKETSPKTPGEIVRDKQIANMISKREARNKRRLDLSKNLAKNMLDNLNSEMEK